MKSLLVTLLAIFSVQLVGAQGIFDGYKSFDEYFASLKVTEVKAKHTNYMIREGNTYLVVWCSDFDIKNADTNIWNIDQLPKLTLINVEKLERLIEKVMPKQDKADEITSNVFMINLLANPTTGEIVFAQFSYDNKLVMPVEIIEKIDEYLKKNCRLQFEQTKITRKANYIPYDYCYLYTEHEFPK